MTEGTLAEKDEVYRKPLSAGWRVLDADTEALIVPGGLVLRTTDENGNGTAMVFVPCDAYDRRDWLHSKGA